MAQRYRELVLERHPDRNGTDEAMHELTQARDAVLSQLVQSRSLVSLETAQALVRLGQAGSERQAARNRAEHETSRIVEIGLGRLAQTQQMLIFLGGLSGAAVIGSKLGSGTSTLGALLGRSR
ncbi:MAG TPA: hypothetical protein VHI93_01780 [Candidatus Thermoplasmatota archaeon]|nr:hypothetical protein [Candidatus Thermoplasmatota archaeon]